VTLWQSEGKNERAASEKHIAKNPRPKTKPGKVDRFIRFAEAGEYPSAGKDRAYSIKRIEIGQQGRSWGTIF